MDSAGAKSVKHADPAGFESAGQSILLVGKDENG